MTDPNIDLIKKYKEITKEGNEGEIYKWKLINQFNGRPNTEASDFTSEINHVKYSNLIYQMANAVRLQLAKSVPEEYREILKYLFDESIDLQERIINFQQRVSELYKSLGETMNHHHDERTIATFLAFKYPEKYPIYKSSVYSDYCKKLGIPQRAKNQKYLHYIELINDLIKNYITKDQELLTIKQNFLTAESYPDAQQYILAQDIIYQTMGEDEELNATETEGNMPVNDKKTVMKVPLNQILFGPPGTGKTYNSINKALEIINPDFDLNQDRETIKKEFDRLVAEGQIVFTTFHQSMTYEDFIEGIKPLVEENENDEKTVVYDVVDGILKKIAGQAKELKSVHRSDIDWENVDFYKMSLGGKNNPNEHAYCINNNVGGISWGGLHDLSELTQLKNWAQYRNSYREKFPEDVSQSTFRITASFILANMKLGDIVIATKGNHIIDAIGKVVGDYFYDDANPTSLVHFRRIEWFAKDLNTSPEKFFKKNISMQSIYQFYNEDVKIDAFKELTATTEVETKNYVLNIDEINRGNVSQIFGELITLIEEDKRIGNEEAIELLLPYSKDKFGVPSNLYIIGTMNTADRSVEALDTALRRRFVFEEMPPKYNLQGLSNYVFGFHSSEILKTINARIEKLLDGDHAIGHAYFLNKTEEQLMTSFYKNIIPLLQEYFYEDYGKIGLVLGSGFVKIKENTSVFANFDYIDESQYQERESYEILRYFENEKFGEAIALLMNQ